MRWDDNNKEAICLQQGPHSQSTENLVLGFALTKSAANDTTYHHVVTSLYCTSETDWSCSSPFNNFVCHDIQVSVPCFLLYFSYGFEFVVDISGLIL